MAAESWASVDEIAKHLGVVKDSICRWIEGRGLPAHRVGCLWKLKLTEVDAWVKAGGARDARPEPNGGPRRCVMQSRNDPDLAK